VPTLGWRYDEVESKSVTAQPVTANRGALNMDPSVYTLPADYPANQIFKAHFHGQWRRGAPEQALRRERPAADQCQPLL